MNRVHLVLLWHMHQPQYRDPSTGTYVMPWTRLHALKDYWGMVKILAETPGVHVTFNSVPSLGMQVEEYASGQFDDPAFHRAFLPADALTPADRTALLAEGFQANRENQVRRWPRFWELYRRVEDVGAETAASEFSARDWRDLQALSQLAWMDEEYLAHDPIVSRLSRKGANFSEDDKQQIRAKELELLARVLPEYKAAADRGQIELSTTPFYHPILPLLCDSSVARIANPNTTQFEPPFRHPEDAREQLLRARAYHERVFGVPPTGLWPSEGSVSDAVLEMAAGVGFQWFATDEGVLGRTLELSFARDATGVPANAERLYAPLAFRTPSGTIAGFFRDHQISDLVGFVYNRMEAAVAAEDFHRRIRAIGERVSPDALKGRPLTVSVILDGENAWEYYAGNGREFLRQFYRRIESDADIRALTVTEALAAAGEIASVEHIFPGSWINANFDIWIGHPEDLRAWEVLRDAREFYAQAKKSRVAGEESPVDDAQLAAAYEALLASEGSDWCWWFGPEHSSSQDEAFDSLYRKHLSEVYAALGAPAPDALAQPIRFPRVARERALAAPPRAYLQPRIDGRESSYFEWLGSGIYSAERSPGRAAMHGRNFLLRDLYFGFDQKSLYVRLDPFPDAFEELEECEFRIFVCSEEEVRITVHVQRGGVRGVAIERGAVCLLRPRELVEAAFQKILEVRIARELVPTGRRRSISLGVTLWQEWLPVDVLPAEGRLEVQLGNEAYAWPFS